MDRCRVLPFEVGDGPANMGLDEALLESVAEGRSGAIVRTYGWSVPTLSLGYFQPIARADDEHRWRDVPTVRRRTGGGALWHEHEVTYAVVIPSVHPLARTSPDLYRAVHDAVAGLLTHLGLDARRRGGDPGRSAVEPFLCFANRDPEDVVLHDSKPWPTPVRKVVGSAQRRRAGAVLQHGSLLLKRADRAFELPGLGDLADVPVDRGPWARAVAEAIPRALGLEPTPDEVSAIERERAAALAERVYRDPAWTRKR